MKVLLAEPFFPPPSGGPASVAAGIVDALVECGHTVEVLCAAPMYRGRYGGPQPPKREQPANGVPVRRIGAWARHRDSLLGRAFWAALFAVQFVFHLLIRVHRHDLVVTSTYPPVIATAMVRWVCRLSGTPFVYHCQDLNPEAAVLAGIMRRGPILAMLTHMEQMNRERAARIVVLSRDMAETLLDQLLPPEKVKVINNFIGERSWVREPDLRSDEPSRAEFMILFAGNMGPLQELDTALDAARQLEVAAPRVRWVFAGDGPEAQRLEQRAREWGLSTIEFRPFLPGDEIRAVMRDCDLALVSIARGVERVAYPSKMLDYMREGCRLLAVVEPASELALLILSNDIGSVAVPGDPSSVVAAVVREAGIIHVSADRSRIAGLAREFFSESRGGASWVELLESVGQLDLG